MNGINHTNACFRDIFIEKGNNYFLGLKKQTYLDIVDNLEKKQIQKDYLNKDVEYLVEDTLKNKKTQLQSLKDKLHQN